MIVCLEPKTEYRTPYTLSGSDFSVFAEASEPIEHKFFAGAEERSFGGGWGTEGKFEVAMQLSRGERALRHVMVNHTDHHVAVSFQIYNGWSTFNQQHGLVRYEPAGCLPLLAAGLALVVCVLFFC